jgi:hypothetical protein
MKKKTIGMLAAILLLCGVTTARAQDAVEVLQECDTTWHFGYKGINIYSRNMHRIDIAYPSVDAKGQPVRLSGSIIIPKNIYDGNSPVDGVLLYNRYTQTQKGRCPSEGFAEGEFVFMCTPLQPNWILVESDFYGFGITREHIADQYYVYGDANGHASVDCYLAAREILEQRNISQGKFLINAGCSSGGYDALATQRVRDMYYADEVFFNKTIAGMAPFDVDKAYSTYMSKVDDPEQEAIFALVVLNCYNRLDNLGFTPQDMYKEPLASKIEEWINSGNYTTDDIRDSLKLIGNKLSDFLQPALYDASSDECQKLRASFNAHSLAEGWTPDTTQSYFYMHYFRDTAVPINSGRALLSFLTPHGYKKSIVPELTKLTTSMFIPSKSHSLCGIQFMLHLAATLTAYPVLYYDGELNTHYYDLVKVGTPMGIVKLLEEKGFDLQNAIASLTGGSVGGDGSMDFFSLMATLNQFNEQLQELGTDLGEVIQVASDCGLELTDIMEIINYLNSKNEESEESGDTANVPAMRKMHPMEDMEPLVGDYYYNFLLNWLKENNIDLENIK